MNELLDILNKGCQGAKHTKETFCDVFASTGYVEVGCFQGRGREVTCEHCRQILFLRTKDILDQLLCPECSEHKMRVYENKSLVFYQDRSKWAEDFKCPSPHVCSSCTRRCQRDFATLRDIYLMMQRMEERLDRIEQKIKK